MRAPKPGRPVRGSRTGRPIMVVLDLLGRRWALRIMWELRDGSLNFRALQTRCGDISASILNRRLAELREAGIVELGEGGYALTIEGRRLCRALKDMDVWAKRWAARTR